MKHFTKFEPGTTIGFDATNSAHRQLVNHYDSAITGYYNINLLTNTRGN